MSHTPTQWSSRLAFILAATGAAVGLGNIWRFPYIAAENGGSAFVIIYLICIALIGIPILIAEIAIGRTAKKAPVKALSSLGHRYSNTSLWSLLGWWGALALLLILSFYSVVSGWSMAYLLKTLQGTFHNTSPEKVQQVWTQFMANPVAMVVWHTLFMILTLAVLIAGVTQGIEKATKFMMPALYVILIGLVIYAAQTGYFLQAVHYLFDFDPHKITASVVIEAMGQAFFSLALGAGAMLMYGAYVADTINIGKTAIIVALLDVLVAILSGLALFPLIFAHHLPSDSGPGLMFITLPIAFSHLHYGACIGSLFFILLLFAAWTSSINLAEPILVILQQQFNITRTRAALITGGCAWLLGIGSALSFNVWHNVKIFDHFTLFSLATDLPMNILLPIGGLGFAIFAGWVMPKEITQKVFSSRISYVLWRLLIRYLAPVAIIIIFLNVFI